MYVIKVENQAAMNVAAVVYGIRGLYINVICNDGKTVQPLSVEIPYRKIESLTFNGKDITQTCRPR